jgi:acyl-coenzyme A synthetase/AMP-(fatty) acid ligase
MEAMLADTVVDRFQVAPTKLEAILTTHPYVVECAVCGLQDEGRSDRSINCLCHAISRRT